MSKQEKQSRDFKGIWIPKEIWLSEKLTLQEKVFLVEIHSLDNEDGCFANNEYFAKFFGLSKVRVSNVIKSLIQKEFIASEINKKLGNRRILNVKSFAPIKGNDNTLLKETITPSKRKVYKGIKENDKHSNTDNNTDNNTNKEKEPSLSNFSKKEKNEALQAELKKCMAYYLLTFGGQTTSIRMCLDTLVSEHPNRYTEIINNLYANLERIKRERDIKESQTKDNFIPSMQTFINFLRSDGWESKYISEIQSPSQGPTIRKTELDLR